MIDLAREEEAIAQIVRSVRTVAVIGMRDAKGGGPGYRIPMFMQQAGVRVIPVNPTISEALGIPSRPNLAAVGEPVDVVQIFRRSENVPAHADEVLALPPALRPRVVWMQSGIVHQDAARRLRSAGIHVVMDRCMSVEMARHR
jgi:hypothetical protein